MQMYPTMAWSVWWTCTSLTAVLSCCYDLILSVTLDSLDLPTNYLSFLFFLFFGRMWMTIGYTPCLNKPSTLGSPSSSRQCLSWDKEGGGACIIIWKINHSSYFSLRETWDVCALRLFCLCFFNYLADDVLYWLQPYSQSRLWPAGIQQEHSLVPPLWSLDRLCKPPGNRGKRRLVNHAAVKWGIIHIFVHPVCRCLGHEQVCVLCAYPVSRCWTSIQTLLVAAASRWDRGTEERGWRWPAASPQPAPAAPNCTGSSAPRDLRGRAHVKVTLMPGF